MVTRSALNRHHLVVILLATIIVGVCTLYRRTRSDTEDDATILSSISHGHGRRLESKGRDAKHAKDGWFADVPHIFSLATSSPSKSNNEQLRVLIVTTSLVQYDKGTRGTTHGYDRLQHVMLPQLVDSVSSMTSRGWLVTCISCWVIRSWHPIEDN